MSSSPPPLPPSGNDATTSTSESDSNPSTSIPPGPPPPESGFSMFSFTIFPDGPPGQRNHNQGVEGNAPMFPGLSGPGAHQPSGERGSGHGHGRGQGDGIVWQFHITPEPGQHPQQPSQSADELFTSTQERSRDTSTPTPNADPNPNPNNLTDDAAPPPPWIFPPFFNFFMPLHTEPRPDPEKAKELVRSLPTVGRGLLKRVDRIVSAQEVDEDEKGWKCGICLEGEGEIDVTQQDDEVERKGTGVKALPCNHLFHEHCLEPWFTTKHTCPACRLDLDPLHTLRDHPNPRRNPLRPTATGSSRPASPHPYARDIQTPTPSGTESAADATATATDGSTNTPPHHHRHHGQSSLAQVSIFWTMPPRSASPAVSNQNSDAIPPQSTTASPAPPRSMTPPILAPLPERLISPDIYSTAFLNAPSTPGPIFGSQTHASPMAMDRRSSPAPGPSASTESQGPNDETTSQQREGTPVPPNAEPSTTDDNRPRPERRSHFTFFRSSPGPNGGGNGIPFTPFMLGQQGQGQQRAPDVERKRTPTPFVPQSLESWTEEREKSLGWRCDAPECLYAPSTDPDEFDVNIDMDVDSDDEETKIGKEMVNIYSPLQPLEGVPSSSETNKETGTKKPFVILACPHRWHRSCLDTAERSAGRMLNRQEVEEGKTWVRCERCRKDGWVLPCTRTRTCGHENENEQAKTMGQVIE